MSHNVTEEEAIHPDRVAEVLLKGMSSEKHFSLPERRKYFLGIQPPRHSADTSSLAA
jgi:hypothetical protein